MIPDVLRIVEAGGQAGLAIAALTAVIYLWRALSHEREARLHDLERERNERLADLKSLSPLIQANAESIKALTETLKAHSERIDRWVTLKR